MHRLHICGSQSQRQLHWFSRPEIHNLLVCTRDGMCNPKHRTDMMSIMSGYKKIFGKSPNIIKLNDTFVNIPGEFF